MWWILSSHLLWVTVILLGALKIYVKLTTGVCRSRRRLEGKTAIVTGANTGIGKETARDLAQRGAKVILACRDVDKGRAACEDIIASTGNSNVTVRHLDLCSLASVRKFANDIIKSEPHLEILVNNAGAAGMGNKKTSDNLLIGMQVNHFGPFLLTCLLTGLLKRSAPSRIVVVSALAHRIAKFDLDNLNSEKWFEDIQVYCCSKVANILMANELSRRLKNTGVTVNSLHPGVVFTEFSRNMHFLIKSISDIVLNFFYKSPWEGAQTSIYLAVSDEVEGVTGKYFSDCKEASTSPAAKDEGLAKKLWEISERLVGLKQEEMDL